MNVSRTIRSTGRPANLVAAAVAAAILAATPAAHAQDAPAAGQSASAPASTPGSSASQAPSSPAPASATSSGTAPATAGQAPPAGQSTGTKNEPVCFKLTGHCVDSSKAAAKAGTAGGAKAASGKKPLNLTAPDVRTVVPESELKEPLPTTDQVTETQEADTVSVKTEQGVPPDVPGGFGAIWWAVNHPSQAWRILAPAE
jgi:hypothetical protein